MASNAVNMEALARALDGLGLTGPAKAKMLDLVARGLATAERVEWPKVVPLGPDRMVQHAALPAATDEEIRALAGRVAVLKLNGGLGTSMGCVGPKSVIKVRSGKCFLELVLEQIMHLNNTLKSNIPLVLMNSFNTEKDTVEVVSQPAYQSVRVLNFNQSQMPRIRRDTLLPLATAAGGNPEHWYPPGHGDVLDCLQTSGILDALLAEGRDYLFVSNIDNLGATLDFRLLKQLVTHNHDILMELTPKTSADVKGGTVIEYSGRLKLLEAAQVPSDRMGEFKSVRKFGVFNTNNIWFNLPFLKSALARGTMKLDVITNPKTVEKVPIIQLETAVGSSISCAEHGCVVSVPRSRFMPVKTCNDLFVVASNLYVLDHGALVMNPSRNFDAVPLVSLGPLFQKVNDYQARVPNVPDLLELDSLTVSGDVAFGANSVLRGHVVVVAPPGQRLELPPGTVLENKTVVGNMVMLDR